MQKKDQRKIIKKWISKADLRLTMMDNNVSYKPMSNRNSEQIDAIYKHKIRKMDKNLE